ncbi:hypothetical protein [Dictyobacter formicarum]|nr:hypothetical protein [Dictyobacter formicarum]
MQQQIDPIIWNALQAGEQVRWWGYPGPNAQISNIRKKLLLEALIGGICGAVLFPLVIFYLSHPRPSLSSMLVALVIGMVFFPLIILGRSLYGYRRVLRREAALRNALPYTRYAITDRRVLIITQMPGQSPSIMVYHPHELAPIKRVDQAAGWGDLSFGSRRGRFANIPSVGYVEQMLRSFQ